MGKHAEKLNKLAEKKKADKIIAYVKSRDKASRFFSENHLPDSSNYHTIGERGYGKACRLQII